MQQAGRKYCTTAAYLISHFQTGLKNMLDRAILASPSHEDTAVSVEGYEKIDEIPFDFQRRRMSVVVRQPDGSRRMLTKGAPEEVFRRCTRFVLDGEVSPMAELMTDELKEEYERLSADGFRVLGAPIDEVPFESRSKSPRESLLRLLCAFNDLL